MEMAGGPTSHVQDLPYVQSAGKGWVWRGMRLSSTSNRKNVCVQEAGKETDQKTEGRGDGAHREEYIAKDQLEIRRVPGVCL